MITPRTIALKITPPTTGPMIIARLTWLPPPLELGGFGVESPKFTLVIGRCEPPGPVEYSVATHPQEIGVAELKSNEKA